MDLHFFIDTAPNRPNIAQKTELQMDLLMYLKGLWNIYEGEFWTNEKFIRQQIGDLVKNSGDSVEKMKGLLQNAPDQCVEV